MGECGHESRGHHIFGHTDNWNRPGGCLEGAQLEVGTSDDCVRSRLDHNRGHFRYLLGADAEAARNDREVMALDETVETQLVEERGDRRRVPGDWDQEAETIGTAWPLRVRRKRPGNRRYGRRTAKKRDEVAPL
jgi:hypothetical protein